MKLKSAFMPVVILAIVTLTTMASAALKTVPRPANVQTNETIRIVPLHVLVEPVSLLRPTTNACSLLQGDTVRTEKVIGDGAILLRLVAVTTNGRLRADHDGCSQGALLRMSMQIFSGVLKPEYLAVKQIEGTPKGSSRPRH